MATSMAFCKDGSPVQALLAALRRLLVCSCGLPVHVDNAEDNLYLFKYAFTFLLCFKRLICHVDLQLLKHATKILHTLT